MPLNVISTTRSNPSIWRLARFLNHSFGDSDTDHGWNKVKDLMYDKAAEIMKRIGHNGVFE